MLMLKMKKILLCHVSKKHRPLSEILNKMTIRVSRFASQICTAQQRKLC